MKLMYEVGSLREIYEFLSNVSINTIIINPLFCSITISICVWMIYPRYTAIGLCVSYVILALEILTAEYAKDNSSYSDS